MNPFFFLPPSSPACLSPPLFPTVSSPPTLSASAPTPSLPLDPCFYSGPKGSCWAGSPSEFRFCNLVGLVGSGLVLGLRSVRGGGVGRAVGRWRSWLARASTAAATAGTTSASTMTSSPRPSRSTFPTLPVELFVHVGVAT